jgi:hypothetical protein
MRTGVGKPCRSVVNDAAYGPNMMWSMQGGAERGERRNTREEDTGQAWKFFEAR